MPELMFADRKRLVLGVRAAGLLLVGIGIAAPTLLIGCVVQAAMSPRTQVPFATFGLIDRVSQILGSKAFLLDWLQSAGLWLVALVLGLWVLRRDAVAILRLSGRRSP